MEPRPGTKPHLAVIINNRHYLISYSDIIDHARGRDHTNELVAQDIAEELAYVLWTEEIDNEPNYGQDWHEGCSAQESPDDD